METRKTPLVLTASALAMALVLVGCGGGSSGSPQANTTALSAPDTSSNDNTDTDTKADPEPVTLPTSMYLMGDDAPMALADTAAPISLMTGEMHGAGAYDFACTAGPCEITIEGGEVMATGTVTVAFNMKYADMIKTNMDEMKVEMDGRAAGQHEALTRSSGADDIFNTDRMVTPVRIPGAGAPSPTDIVITRDLTGDLMVMRDRDGWQHDPDMPPMAAASLGGTGWAGKVLSNGATQSITVYSNIENAKREDFSADDGSIYAHDQGTAGNISHLPGATTNTTTASDQAVILTLTEADINTSFSQGLLDGDFFPAAGKPGTGTKTYQYGDTAGGTEGHYQKSFSGIFHGASGKYACQANDECTIAVTPADEQNPATYAATGGWTFTPDGQHNKKNDAQLVKQDNDWLSFGWWISRPSAASKGGDYQYEAQVFYGGPQKYEAMALGELGDRSAKYTGRAAGLYAVKAHKDGDTDVPSAHGEFMADAALTASFKAGNPANVSGKIDNFTAANGTVSGMSDWALTLLSASASNSGGAGDPSVAFRADVESAATGKLRAGEWEGQFYGAAGGATRKNDPSGIAGRFTANIDGNSAVAGGFGATK